MRRNSDNDNRSDNSSISNKSDHLYAKKLDEETNLEIDLTFVSTIEVSELSEASKQDAPETKVDSSTSKIASCDDKEPQSSTLDKQSLLREKEKAFVEKDSVNAVLHRRSGETFHVPIRKCALKRMISGYKNLGMDDEEDEKSDNDSVKDNLYKPKKLTKTRMGKTTDQLETGKSEKAFPSPSPPRKRRTKSEPSGNEAANSQKAPVEDPKQDEEESVGQCVVKFQLWKFNTVCNVAFAESPRGYLFKCMVRGCRFQCLVKSTLKSHLEAKHKRHAWNGFCNICMNTVTKTSSKSFIADELVHMQKHLVEVAGHSEIEFHPESALLPARKSVPATQSPKVPAGITIKKVSVPSKQNITPKTKDVIPPEPTAKTPEPTSILTKPTEEQSSCRLRPWLVTGTESSKSTELITAMLSRTALCATYKCLSSTCSFFTDDSILFLKHLRLHDDQTPEDKLNYLKCSYCDFVGTSAIQLLNHIEIEHDFDRFQCSYCFYRSCKDFNVQNHQKAAHAGLETNIIECTQMKSLESNSIQKARANREKYVRPMICVFCRDMFFLVKCFKKHLETHESRVKAKCIQCGAMTGKDCIMNHLEKCLGFGLYQCINCEFGSNKTEDLIQHYANKHPSKEAVFCERSIGKTSDGSYKNVSRC